MKENVTKGAISAATGLTGLWSYIDQIPDSITKLACLVGIFGTLAIIVKASFESRKLALECRKLELETKAMSEK